MQFWFPITVSIWPNRERRIVVQKKVIPMFLVLCLLTVTIAMAANSVSAPSAPRMPSGGMESKNAPQMPEDFDPSKMPEDFDPSKMPTTGNAQNPMPNTAERPATNQAEPASPDANQEAITHASQASSANQAPQTQPNRENSQFGGGFGGMGGWNMQAEQPEQPTGFLGFLKTYLTPVISVILLALAFVFVGCYKRKNY